MMEQILGPTEDVPEYYVDAVRIGFGPYGFALEIGVQGISDTQGSEKAPTKRLALIRMSPQHALVVSKLLQKNLAAYQDRIGPIILPDEMYGELGIDK